MKKNIKLSVEVFYVLKTTDNMKDIIELVRYNNFIFKVIKKLNIKK